MKETEEIKRRLRRIKAKKIFIQFPEGLKQKIQEIVKNLEKEFDCIICCEPTYGACDLRDEEARRLGCDAILHIGHSSLGLKSKLPVIYWEYLYEIDPVPVLRKEIRKLKNFKKIGLITSLQFVKTLERVKRFLEDEGKEVYMKKSLKYPGQVLGCDTRAAKDLENKVDCFLYVGAGKFHPIGVALRVRKPVLCLDLEKKSIYDLEKEKKRWLKLKAWYESKLKEAKRVGIIISWKKGQNRINEARKLKKNLERKGKEVYILAFDRVTLDKLSGLKIDYWINLACPRLEEDLILSKLCE